MSLFIAAVFAVGALAASPAAPAAEGGSQQAGAQSGCMNQWANGTNYGNISPVDTQVQDMALALQNGDTMTSTDTTIGNLTQQKLFYHSFPQSGQFTHKQPFFTLDQLSPDNKPAKPLVTFDVASYKKNHPGPDAKYWKTKTPGYNYRIDLTCTK